MADSPILYERIGSHEISALPPEHPWYRHYMIKVERRGDLWHVFNVGYYLNSRGEWDPSFEDSWPLLEAIRRAYEAAPKLEVNGRTAVDVLAYKGAMR